MSVTLCHLSRNFVATHIAREIGRCIMSRNQQVSQYYCTKYNQVLLFAIVATLQRIFKALYSITTLLQLVSQYLYTEYMAS